MMKRPPEITQLTAERRTKSTELFHLLKKTRKYCGKASTEIQASMHGRSPPDIGARHLRSQTRKERFGLTVPDCRQCDGRLIEAFQEENMALSDKMPLYCDHKIEISNTTPLGPERRDNLASPITIPVTRIPGAMSDPSVASSQSSVTIDKLTVSKEELENVYKEVHDLQVRLEEALELVPTRELEGYNGLYSSEAMERYKEKQEVKEDDVFGEDVLSPRRNIVNDRVEN